MGQALDGPDTRFETSSATHTIMAPFRADGLDPDGLPRASLALDPARDGILNQKTFGDLLGRAARASVAKAELGEESPVYDRLLAEIGESRLVKEGWLVGGSKQLANSIKPLGPEELLGSLVHAAPSNSDFSGNLAELASKRLFPVLAEMGIKLAPNALDAIPAAGGWTIKGNLLKAVRL